MISNLCYFSLVVFVYLSSLWFSGVRFSVSYVFMDAGKSPAGWPEKLRQIVEMPETLPQYGVPRKWVFHWVGGHS